MNQALVERNKRFNLTLEFKNAHDKHDIPQVTPMSDVSMFHLHSEYGTAGDQEEAIDRLMEQIEAGQERCVLMGVTGSGKTFAMANIIQRLGLPTLILSHNKTLARQLWQEMSELFPENAVEYFVSYYDYYQPEAYLPNRDLYIDKELQMNERIEQERFSTVASLVTRPDVITVGTVSAIYGLNPPEAFQESYLHLQVGESLESGSANISGVSGLDFR